MGLTADDEKQKINELKDRRIEIIHLENGKKRLLTVTETP